MKKQKEILSEQKANGIIADVTRSRLPVIWDRKEFYGINRFDCHIVDLQTTEEGGGYFTCIPISPLDYRKEHPTKAKATIHETEHYVEFWIYNDWGGQHIMRIPRTMTSEIDMAKKSAIEFGLLASDFS